MTRPLPPPGGELGRRLRDPPWPTLPCPVCGEAQPVTDLETPGQVVHLRSGRHYFKPEKDR